MGGHRILHLIDPATPGGGACTLRLLGDTIAHLPELDHDVIVLGSRAHAALARRCGVEVDGVVCPPLRHPVLARRALARAITRRETDGSPYERVHAWSWRSGCAAALAAPTRRRVATVTVGPIGSPHPFGAPRPTPLLATSPGVADAYAAAGCGRHALRVVRPAVAGSGSGAASRDALRERWGVDARAFVVAVVAEPAAWADAMLVVRTMVRLASSGRPVHFVLYHGASARAAAERWARRTGHGGRIHIDDAVAEPWRVLPGADAALVVTGPDPRRAARPEGGVLPLLQAMTAGVPVVAEETGSVCDIVNDNNVGLVAAPRDVNAMTAAVARLYDDRAAARAMAAAASARVQESFGFEAYRAALLDAYAIR